MRRVQFGLLWAIVLVFIALMLISIPAWAATFDVGFAAERREHHGPVPAVVQVASAQVPADMVGLSCEATFTAVNNESMHDTDLIVDTNGALYVVADVESGAATVRDIGPVTVGSVVVVSLRMNEHNARGFAVSSLGGTVTFDCEEPPSTTTTTPASTSTSSTSPTETTSTLQIVTTTTLPERSSTTTTPESTSTSNPAPSSTVPSTVYPDPTDPPRETLPETGVDSGHLAVIALVALVSGAGLVALTPRGEQ